MTIEVILAIAIILGLIVGSFLNVVIYRMPLIIERKWKAECAELLEVDTKLNDEKISLAFPQSRCPKCKHPIKPWHNVPIVGWLVLHGRCANCEKRISLRYPLVELLTGILTLIAITKFGPSLKGILASLLLWALIVLTFIDYDHKILPDIITLPMIWLGLLLNTGNFFTDTTSSVIGAIVGYMSLWLVYQGFKLLTAKEGMGYGDFKLLAVLGAWLGWQLLLLIILLSSLIGLVVGSVKIIRKNESVDSAIPFGPYLAIAGAIALFYGGEIYQWYLSISAISDFS